MPNNPITKIQVIVLKIRTLILISCQETGCDCVGYEPLLKNLVSNSRCCLDPDNCQSWELSEDFLNNTQHQLIKIKTICYQQTVFKRTLFQAQGVVLMEERAEKESGSGQLRRRDDTVCFLTEAVTCTYTDWFPSNHLLV